MFAKRIFFAVIATGMMLTALNAQSKKFENRSSGQVEAATLANQSPQAAADDGPRDRIEGTRRANPAQAAASTPTNQSPEARFDDGPKDRIEGTWRVVGNFSGSSDKALFTFGAGRDPDQGIVGHSDNFFFVPAPSCLPAQGVWKRTGDRTFIATDEGFCFDSTQNFAPGGNIKFKTAIRLNKQGTEFTGHLHFEFFDVFGNLIFSDDATLSGARMQAEAP